MDEVRHKCNHLPSFGLVEMLYPYGNHMFVYFISVRKNVSQEEIIITFTNTCDYEILERNRILQTTILFITNA